jgi:hypothetical protein
MSQKSYIIFIILCHVTAPDFSKEFKLAVDANGIGVGTVLPQDGNRSADFLLF